MTFAMGVKNWLSVLTLEEIYGSRGSGQLSVVSLLHRFPLMSSVCIEDEVQGSGPSFLGGRRCGFLEEGRM